MAPSDFFDLFGCHARRQIDEVQLASLRPEKEHHRVRHLYEVETCGKAGGVHRSAMDDRTLVEGSHAQHVCIHRVDQILSAPEPTRSAGATDRS